MLSTIIYFQKRHVHIHHVLMAVHVLYLAVVIAVPVSLDLQVYDVKVRLQHYVLFYDLIINRSSYHVLYYYYVRTFH